MGHFPSPELNGTGCLEALCSFRGALNNEDLTNIATALQHGLLATSHSGQQIPSSHPRRNLRRLLGTEMFQNFPQLPPSAGALMNGDTSHSASSFQTHKAQLQEAEGSSSTLRLRSAMAAQAS